MKHIVLIGLSGSGKTTLGRMLSERSGFPMVDTDAETEREAGMPIRRIFERQGEPFFRDMEARAVRAAAVSETPSVIATGGGAVLRSDNVEVLSENGFIVFLDRPAPMIANDLVYDESRPLIQGAEKIYEMERERRALYLEAADYALKNSGGLEEALGELESLLDTMRRQMPEGCEYAVIGNPIAHTLSPAIHGAVFEAIGVSERYGAAQVSPRRLPRFAERARASGMRGFNVTIPHKRNIIPFLDEIEEDAKLCGAVNTVVIGKDGRASGFNTDMGGLLASLKDAGVGYRGSSLLILGAGGAARGIAFKAAREGASAITILARRSEAAEDIASVVRSLFHAAIHTGDMSPDSMRAAASRADILINATPLGMSGIGADFPSFEFLEALPKGAFVCDAVYNPEETELLRAARELGHGAQNGLGMLIYQALLADELFLGRELDKPALYRHVRARLSSPAHKG
jgi:shikimate dehydrogenase